MQDLDTSTPTQFYFYGWFQDYEHHMIKKKNYIQELS